MVPRFSRGLAAWQAVGLAFVTALGVTGIGCGGGWSAEQANGGTSSASAGHTSTIYTAGAGGNAGSSGFTNGGAGGGASGGTPSLTQGGAAGASSAGQSNLGGSGGAAGNSGISGDGGNSGSSGAGTGGGGVGGAGGTSNDPACALIPNLSLADLVVVMQAGPGQVASLTVTVTNTSSEFMDYAGAVLECDEQGSVVTQVSTNWRFGISAKDSVPVGLSATFNASAASGTTVHCRARAAILNATTCQNAQTLPLAFSVK